MSAPTGFVGRQDELHTLGHQLAAARLGDTRIVWLKGEPGAGKSRLLAHFVGSIRDAVVLQASADEDEMLLSYGLLDQLQHSVSTEAGTDPMAVGAGLLDQLDALQTGGAVVVLIVDDLQWADRPSARALLFALRRLRADRVLAVVSSRVDADVDPSWGRFIAGDARVTRVRLGGLNSSDLTALARALGLGTLSARGASRLVAHTQGNVLHCKALLEELGVAALSMPGPAGLPAPRELSGIILSRVAALPAPAQELLAAASVLGQHAVVTTIGAIAQVSDPRRDLDPAVVAGLVHEGPASAELSFAHPLYRAAIYADLNPTRKRELHGRAATLVGGTAGLTHRVAASLGPDEGLAAELEALARAGISSGDTGTTAWALEQAAALSPAAGEPDRRLLDAAVVLLNAADTAAAARVLASCQAGGARWDALTGLLQVYTGLPTAETRLIAAWETHDPITEREIAGRAATSMTNWMVMSGRPEQGVAWAQRAVERTPEGSPVRAMARTAQAYTLAAAGRVPEGRAVLDFLPAAGAEVALAETDALIMRGMLKVYADDLSGAVADLGVAAARVRQGLASTYPGPCLSHLSEAHFRLGEWDAAFAHAQMATAWAQDTDRPLDLARTHGQLAQVLGFRGHFAEAQVHVDAARAAAERFPLVFAVATAATAAAALSAARGDLSGVLAAAARVRAAGFLDVGGLPGVFSWRPLEVDALTASAGSTRRGPPSTPSRLPSRPLV